MIFFDKIQSSPLFVRLFTSLKQIVLPGFEGVPIYRVLKLFVTGLIDGELSQRASSIAFNFFLAIFPTIIFFFTVIPYIPVENLNAIILESLKEFLPLNAFETVKDTIEDIVMRQRSGLLSLGFFMALFFSTSGISSIISAFNTTSHEIETRSWMQQRLVSLYLVLIFSVVIIIAMALISINDSVISYFMTKDFIGDSILYYLIILVKWTILTVTIYFSSSLMFYLAPARRGAFRLFSAGSTLFVILLYVTSSGFNYYILNFSKYNVLYGSLGTLIILLLWIFLNATVLLLGFELNISIKEARLKK